MSQFLSGMIVMGFGVAGLLFTRYWRRTRDTFFLGFAAFFWLFAICQMLVVLSGAASEQRTWFYLVRFAAFLLLLVAIIRKNSEAAPPDSGLK